jgi:subtilisin family serine protease
MQLINAPKAWDVTTGGISASGDTIVVGVLEKGANRQHPDLKPNLWVNWKEIPGNLIDDDQNGYVDDHLGYNTVVGGDAAGEISGHPSGVCGIIGAQGNNSTGVSGVNWNVKILNVVIAGLESDIVKGYNYLGDLRRQYNQSNGQQGAFIVATNASFGIDWDLGGQPENFPLWCAVYDSLGVLGVLSCAATTNKDVDVDEVGDMPTGCTSEYLIAVTEVNQSDLRVPAGLGRKNVDLAAPGIGTWSTSVADSYAFIGGCSAATPHVSGTVALLYSIDCKQFTQDAKSDPAACARRVKEVILQSVKPLPVLFYSTLTGGRLDVGKAVDLIVETCNGDNLGPLSVMSISPNPAQDWVRIDYQTPMYSIQPLRIYNVLGQLMLDTNVESVPFEYSRINVDVSYWHSGTYYVVFGADKGVETKVFVKI